MNVRCLIGHDYGEPETSREREERGDEMVVTVVEYKECTRCGSRQVLSENKEVRSAAPGTDADADADGVDDEAATSTVDPEGDAEELTAEEDDGIILEDEPEEAPTRARGEWPAEPGEGDAGDAPEPRAWPDAEGEDEGYAAAATGSGPAEEVEFRGGLTPESGEGAGGVDEGGEVVAATNAEDGGGEGTIASAPGGSSTQEQRPVGVDTIFVCPQCGHTAPSEGSSLRPGDICPECHKGYLAEREDR